MTPDGWGGWTRRKARATAVPTVKPRTVRLWAVNATVESKVRKGWTSARNLPTFYLDPTVQGIVNETHARQIAREIVGTNATVSHIHVEPIY